MNLPHEFKLMLNPKDPNEHTQKVVSPQVHGNIGFSIKDVESHRDQCQVPLSIIMLFI